MGLILIRTQENKPQIERIEDRRYDKIKELFSKGSLR